MLFLTCNSVTAWFCYWITSLFGAIMNPGFYHINDAMIRENHSIGIKILSQCLTFIRTHEQILQGQTMWMRAMQTKADNCSHLEPIQIENLGFTVINSQWTVSQWW